MGLPYENEDYDEGGGASSVNDLDGMNFSPLNDNELMKRVDANNVGGSGILVNNVGAIGLGATPDYGTAGQVLKSNGSGSGVSWVTPTTTNYTFYNTTDLTLKSGNNTGGHNNNTYNAWVGIYNQSNVLQLSPSITLTSSSRAVKIETNIHARVDRTQLGFRIRRVVAGLPGVIVVGSEQWGRAVPTTVVDDDHFTYCISIVDVPGVANVTYRAEVYASDPGGAGNSFFEINANLVLGGGTNNVNMLLTEL